uniref:Uncharacterized protein n=1 Tax=Romanomermis culicivorax TaxID=13658 RepID=A0A915KG54_ROMCU
MRSSELKWENDLDRCQFEFNEQILDSLRSTLKSLEQGAMSQAVTLVESSIKDLMQCQKLVRFADRNLYAGGPIYFSDQINLTASVICQQNLSPERESSALEIATNSAAVGRNTVAHQEVHCYLKDDMCREKAQSPAAETAENAKGGKMEIKILNMKRVLIVATIFMLAVMDPMIKSNSPTLVAAECDAKYCNIRCKLQHCVNSVCNEVTGNCNCLGCP